METKHLPHGRGTSAQGTTPPYVPQIRLYQQWLHATRGLQFDSYDALWRWSTTELDAFWQSVWDYFDLQSPTPHTAVLAKNTMPGAQWFPGAQVNYVRQVMRHVDAAHAAGLPAIISRNEKGNHRELAWPELRRQVASLALHLKAQGVQPGDRVAAYLPNVPEAMIAFLATASIGAVWSICAPDMGTHAVLDRFRQIEPKVLISVDGVSYGGRDHDRTGVLAELRAGLPSVQHVVLLGNLNASISIAGCASWVSATARNDAETAAFEPMWLAFDHPLWIVYSSGTTGLPKPIVHGHGGSMLVALQLKVLHNDIGCSYEANSFGERYHWYSSTGWVMWNAQMSGLLSGTTCVIFDGNPGGSKEHPDWGVLWRFAAETGVTFFGAGAAFFANCMKAGITLSDYGDLSRIRALGTTGSPLSPEVQQWGTAQFEALGTRDNAAAPGRPKQGAAPSGGSEPHEVGSVGATSVHSFKTEGKVLVKPGWLAIYGKEAADEVEGGKDGDKGQNLVPVKPGEMVNTLQVDPKGLKTKPPARYSEATLLGAMESAGKQIDDDELREAMQEKGLGTPATRAAIIEGLLTEKYMLREGREIIPTAKAFQLMTLLRGLEVEELCRADLTGEWEYKLSQMEKGQLSREAFMAEIAAMTERMVKKAKEYDRDTIPGDYATLESPCPNCGGVVKENYRRYACVGKQGAEGCGFSFGKSPAGRTFETAEAEQLLRDKKIGPLEGFRSKAGWPFTSEIVIKYDDEAHNYKLEFDFGDDKNAEESGELVEFEDASLGACPICGSDVHEHGSNYVCSKAVPTAAQPTPSCTFKSGKVILQQPVEREQMTKLLETGKTDLLDKFVSMRTRRNFKAHLAWDKEAGKVNFEFAPSKFPPRKPAAGAATKAGAATAGRASAAAKKAPAKKAAAKSTAAKAPRKAAAGKAPSAALAAVIGNEPVARPEAVKKMWEYIKANNLQDPKDKRTIVADDKLRAVFGKDSAGMFELAGILGNHLGGDA